METSYDLGLLVPLGEEFEYLTELFPAHRSFSVDADYYYELDIGGPDHSVVANVVGEMGLSQATLAAERLLQRFRPRAVVLVGLAGSLDKDFLLGDVVIGTQVEAYLQSAKAVPAAAGSGFDFALAGAAWPAPFLLLQFTRAFRHRPETSDSFKAWRAEAAERRQDLLGGVDQALARPEPIFDHGPIASGDIVGASTEFSTWLRRHDRSLVAIEMEAGGAAAATHSRKEPAPLLVIRGVSDFADERKSAYDESKTAAGHSGVWRKYAVQNAGSLLRAFLATGDFIPTPRRSPRGGARRTRRPRSSGYGSDEVDDDQSTFVGEGHHGLLRWLRSTWLTEGPAVCLVQGFSGVGKTRVADELGRSVPKRFSLDFRCGNLVEVGAAGWVSGVGSGSGGCGLATRGWVVAGRRSQRR